MKREETKNKKRSSEKNNTLKAIAWAQIFSMILEVFAFCFVMGGMIVISSGNVSAADKSKPPAGWVMVANDTYGAYLPSGETLQTATKLWSPSEGLRIWVPTQGSVNGHYVDATQQQIDQIYHSQTPEGGAGTGGAGTPPPKAVKPTGDVPPAVPGVGAANTAFTMTKDLASVFDIPEGTKATLSSTTDSAGATTYTLTAGGATGTVTPNQVQALQKAGVIKDTQTPPANPNSESGFINRSLSGLKYASIVLGLATAIAAIVGGEQGKNIQMIGLALSAGIQVGSMVTGAMESLGWGKSTVGETFGYSGSTTQWSTVTGFAAGLLVTYLILANNYKDTKTKSDSIEFKCLPWQAPTGGSACSTCNGNPLKPCSEYRCRSLGQTCKLINAGTGQDRCIDSSPNDVTSPGIKPWRNILPKGFSYSNVKERPPGGQGPAGMTILGEGENGCVKAFTPFTFGIITTDIGDVTQPAQCKIDANHTAKMDDMAYWMGGSNFFNENHSEQMTMPGVDNIISQFPGLNTAGDYTFYIRCRDGNGNENRDEFVVKFCVDKTPDNTPPQIITTSIPSGSPVLYKVDNLSINVYTNEPANCKWSRRDSDYSAMEYNMSCSNKIWEMNAQMLYTCETQLTGIKDKEENKFYFRCQDTSPKKNPMSQSYPFILIGTQPLTILSTGPTGTIGSSTNVANVTLTVDTDNGYINGQATCSYSTSSDDSTMTEMFDTGDKNTHSQPLDLAGGSYHYYFKCIDAGGNVARNETSFSVYVDKAPPMIVRAYGWESKLIVVTDELSSCSFSTASCNFDPAAKLENSMPYDFDPSKQHMAEWKNDQSYYIKCFDEFGNAPEPSECSMIIRPYQLPSMQYQA